ncbi:MAG: cbb3-type cytochrome c oxidase subunit I, partial [Pseudomonadota bacterium]|nr:cbb3-type cytochrome c oxidase subunit I [Pseudomonadota bacterium]
MFGKLSWSAIPFDQPIPLITSIVVIAVILGTLIFVTVKGWWPYLWREWITTVDHKRIGIMYILLGVVMLIRGFADAIMMRTQQAIAINAPGYLPPEHYDQIFSAHGAIMIFFAAMPLVIGFMNFVVPLQLGVRDVAFPTMNSVSFWLTSAGALLVNVSLFVGEFARTGWIPYPPLSETTYSPGVGVDYYLWAVQISGIGTMLTGINFVTTILKMRCKGMSYMRMPMFCWTAFASSLMIVAVFPILTATLAMLTLDRYFGFHFFTNTAGGNPMMFMNLIWAWGHPEVYILVLPAFGIFSEVFSTFSGKPLFGYRSMVAATLFICIVSMTTWLHHFFTMGAGAAVNTAFGISTSIIAVGTGVKIYNWIFTMYGGRIRFETPMLWSMAFIFTFVIGGVTGVLLAVPPADYVVHNSMFLVAHFHNVIVGGVVFAIFAGYEYWFPKAFGFRLHPGWGKAAFWFALIGFWVTFAPLYVVGMQGMTRRLQHIDIEPWRPYMQVALVGVGFLIISALCQVTQLVVSIIQRDRLRDVTGDPWDGRSLEWATPSPAPFFNFAVTPDVEGEEA